MYKIYIKKFLLAMKLTTLMLFIAIMQVSAVTRAQKVTLSDKNAPLTTVFQQIRTQTGYDFAYTTKTLENAKLVTINVKDAELNEVLKKIFDGQPLEYSIEDKSVVISIKEPSFIDKAEEVVKDFFANTDVTGRVLDEQGLPIASATVTVKGTSNATITDAKGYFTLKSVDRKAIIVVSVIGYEKKEVQAANDIGDVKLIVATSKLDEVHVIAYGQTSERLSTGNISAVSSKEIEEQPVSNPLLALEGRVPGLFITQGTGNPGTGVTVRIQGQNSIIAGLDPLYVIDGMAYPSQMAPTTQGGIARGSGATAVQGGGGGNPLSYINPSDIESIEVLKDADATSIYGSRAANGAIIITTKKGKAGPMKVDVDYQQGWGKVTDNIQMMNSQQVLAMRHEAKMNDNAVIGSTDYDLNGLWDTTRTTNWKKALIGGTSQYNNLNGSISGGNANSQYLVGGNYHRETTVFPGDFSDQKGGLHFNFNNTSANQKFRFQFSGNYQFDNNQLPTTDLAQTALNISPVEPSLYSPDGSLNWAPNAAGSSSWTNPLSFTLNRFQSLTNNLVSSAILSYNILPGLIIQSNFGYNNLQTNETSFSALLSTAPENRATFSRTVVYTASTIKSWQIEPQLNYKGTIWKGKLDVLLGTSIFQTDQSGQILFGLGFPNDAVEANIASAASVIVGSTAASAYKYNALFGRLNYNIFDKYILNFTTRRDGSSRFGPQNQFHDFSSIAGAWIFSEEDFFKKTLSFISFGKLKASYGTTGNDQIGDYSYLNLYSPVSQTVAYQGAGGLILNGLYNPILQWEETHKLSFGLSFGFFKDRILLDATYSRNRSSNELLQYALPNITGNTGIRSNFPATVQNTSFEFTLNTKNIVSKDFKWSSTINLTIPNNTLIAFPNLATSTYANSLIIGQPITIKKVFHFLGVDPATGVYEFADSQGNPTTSPNGTTDNTVLINTLPKFYGGFQNSFSYKGLQLDILFQFVKQKGQPGDIFGLGSTPGASAKQNQPAFLLSETHWQHPGDIADIQRYNSSNSLSGSFSNANASDAAYTDASFVRLKNLSLSYKVPATWVQKAHIQSFSVFIQGQNLLTITKFKGLDPENQLNVSLPPLTVLTVGVKVGL